MELDQHIGRASVGVQVNVHNMMRILDHCRRWSFRKLIFIVRILLDFSPKSHFFEYLNVSDPQLNVLIITPEDGSHMCIRVK